MCKSVYVAPFDIPNQSANFDVGAGDLQWKILHFPLCVYSVEVRV
jgi:hypothetical protein